MGETICFGCNITTYAFQLPLLGAGQSVNIDNGRVTGEGPIMRLNFMSETEGTPKAGIYKDLGSIVTL